MGQETESAPAGWEQEILRYSESPKIPEERSSRDSLAHFELSGQKHSAEHSFKLGQFWPGRGLPFLCV